MNIPELPIQVLAVTENNFSGGAGAIYSNTTTELEALLVNEGSSLADRLNAHFMTSSSAIQQKCKVPTALLLIIMLSLVNLFFSVFLHTVLQRGP